MSAGRAGAGRSRPRHSVEQNLLGTAVFCLLAFGAIMVYSASSAASLESGGDSAQYLKRYAFFALLGLGAMALTRRLGAAAVRRFTPALLVVSFVGMLATLAPGIGHQANGAQRWIGLGGFTVQPSEVAKLALILYAAQLLADRPLLARGKTAGALAPVAGMAGTACLLIIVQRDLGTALIVAGSMTAMLVAAGISIRRLALVGGAIALAGLALTVVEPYRMARLTAFLHPAADPQGAGFQVLQARIALGSGGIFGVGLGESVQKIFYLPEAHTDMILAVIGEELGLLGVGGVVALYGLLGYAGFQIARRARDRYAALLAAGLTSLVLGQATLNFFGVLGLAPLTGVPLPLISYGGSSLIVLLAALGILQAVAGPQWRAAAAGAPRRAGRRPAKARPAGIPAGPLGVVEDGRIRIARAVRQGQRTGKGRGNESRDRNRRDGGARGARARDRRRAAG